MGGYLPQVFERFGAHYPAVMEAFRGLAERLHEAGPLSGEGASAGEARDRHREGIRGRRPLPRTEGPRRGHRARGHPAGGAARHLDRGLPGRHGCLRLDQGPGSRDRASSVDRLGTSFRDGLGPETPVTTAGP
jgi:hypothetical protein